MKRNFNCLKHAVILTAFFAVFYPTESFAAAESAAEEAPAGGGYCISKEVENTLGKCPEGIELGKRSRANVGTTTKKELLKKA